MRRTIVFLLVLLILINVNLSYSTELIKEAYVTKIVSGNTVVLKSGEIVKLIGVVTSPEISDAKKEYFNKKITRFNEKLIKNNNRIIRLEYDKEMRDKYNNLLAYVYVDKIFLNAELIKKGFFAVPSDFKSGKYFEHFKHLEAEAKEQKRGIWANLAKQIDLYTGPVVGTKRRKKYHGPDCRFVLILKETNKVEFKNQDEAIAAGYTPCFHCRPDKKLIKFIKVEEK